MSEPKKRPGFWWMLFYGRRRRGLPLLLIVTFALIGVLALAFTDREAAAFLRDIAPFWIISLLGGAILVAALAVIRPRRRR